MSRLNGLLETLVTVIVRYHDQKRELPAAQESEQVHALLDKPHAELYKTLHNLVEASTANDKARLSLLMYTLHTVDLLKSLFDSQTPTEEEPLNLIKKQVLQFIVDVQTLLTTSQSSELIIKYNNHDTRMYGFMRAAWRGYSLCTSGHILQQTLFPTLRLPSDATLDKVDVVINDIFKEHTLLLLIRTQEQENHRLSSKVVVLEKELENAKSELRAAETSKPTAIKHPVRVAHDEGPVHRSKSSGSIASTHNRAARPPKFSFLSMIAEGLGLNEAPIKKDESARIKTSEPTFHDSYHDF